ncbi:MAG: hypothetical protein KUF79_09725 [Candidatus Thiodiazotropha sp. (ex Ctena orbiculata)]|nr:hypothetical protein [Candidatus Thiodiazotropha taylori]
MSQLWAERQRRTNRLVRCCYSHLRLKHRLNAETLYALFQLTWITDSHEDANAGYLRRAKIPALEAIFDQELTSESIESIALELAPRLEARERKLATELISKHSGFTNFYKVYRNSALDWVRENVASVKSITSTAYALKSDREARRLANRIEQLPSIRSPGGGRSMNAQYFITPLVFALDPRLRFPIINGRDHVKKLLKEISASHGSLPEQYDALTSLIGIGGIQDAADLDQVRGSIGKFIGKAAGKSRLARTGANGKALELKDEHDYEVLKRNLSITALRVHNELTNRLLDELCDYTILEGQDPACRYDALVQDYDEDGDLLIEVKSSTNIADVRMAIGQLFDYHRQLTDGRETSKAVLLPEAPDENVKALIRYAGVGLMYFDDNGLHEEWW